MTTAGFGPQVGRRRKWITRLVAGALAATLMTVLLAYWWSIARRERPLHIPRTLPSNIHQQLSGYSFTRSEEGRRIFTVHAARTVAFKHAGTTVLEDVLVEVFGRSGSRRDIMRTGRCDYNAQSGDLFSSGAVEIELNAQVDILPGANRREQHVAYIQTSQVSFRQQGSLVVSNELVRFQIGPATGSARGMTYATKDGWLELKKDVAVELGPRAGGKLQPAMRLFAARLRYERTPGPSSEVVLSGPLVLTQGNRRVVGKQGRVLLDSHNRVTQVVLDGGVEALGSSEAGLLQGGAQRVQAGLDPRGGQLRTLQAEGDVHVWSRLRDSVNRLEAQQLEMTFDGVHPQPQSGSASGNVRLTLESSASPSSNSPPRAAISSFSAARIKTLTAAHVRVAFRPGGRSLREAQTVGPGTVVLVPLDPTVGERMITAGSLAMGFDARSRLETLRGSSGTQIIIKPPAHAPPESPARVTSSERLEAKFDPATEALQALEQVGDFQFREGDRQASAGQARYESQAEVLTLTGQPRVWDASTRARAEVILFDLRTDTAEGLGKVQCTHFGTAGQAVAGHRDPQAAVAGDPTNVIADRMLAQRRSQFVHYEGHVRVWHNQDVVESSAVDVYRVEQRVRSGSGVLTSHFQPASPYPSAPPGSTAKRETRPVTIRADRLDYYDQGHKASYRGNVQLQAEKTQVHADRLDVYFSTAGNGEASEVERAVADGHVTVEQPARHASGEHAEYDAAPGKILLTGGPPLLYDAAKGFTTGQRLTFFIHDDRVFVDGGEESPTLSKRRIPQ